MKKIKPIQQTEHSDCGLACTTMLLNYCDIPEKLNNLLTIYGVPKGGNNLFEMKKVLSDYGVETKAIKIELDSITPMILPAIAFWDSDHFVIVERINKRNVTIIDPEFGKQKLTFEDFLYHFRNVLLIIESSNIINKELTDRNIPKSQIFVLIKRHLKRYFVLYLILLVLTLVFELLSLNLSIQIKDIIDNVANDNVIKFILPVVLALILMFVFQISRSVLIEKLKYSFNIKITTQFVRKLTELPFKFFVNKKSSDIFYRYNLISYMQQILNSQLINTLVNVLFSFIYLVIMFTLSPELASITLCVAVLIILISLMNNRYILKMNPMLMKFQNESQGTFIELVNGMETIKSVNAESNFLNIWLQGYQAYQDVQYKVGVKSAVLTSMTQFLQYALPFILIFSGGILISNNIGTWGITIGFSTIATGFIQPLSELTNLSGQLVMLFSYGRKIDDVLTQESMKNEPNKGLANDEFKTLQVSNGKFSFSVFEKNLIDEININFDAGNKIAIVGPSGSGKSTLLRYISGLYESSKSVINYNGVDKNNINYDTYRNKLIYIPQFSEVFGMSLYDNIIMNNLNIEDAQFKDVLKVTNLLEFVEELPQGANTIISEDGHNISGGQKQKISIARALIKDPDVLLMDESTSSLDYTSESTIIQNLMNIDKTVVFATHRLNSIQSFDKIIVMNHGKISGIGTHDELLKNNDIYRNMNKSGAHFEKNIYV